MRIGEAIASAVAGDEVSAGVLEGAFGEIVAGQASPVQIAALLVALRTKGETVGEIVAAARALRAQVTARPRVDVRTVDTAGTGGDQSGTFNISTVAAFVVAGAGVPVAKHGNRAVSSSAGSMDLFEEIGVRIDLPIETCAAILAEVGIAPFFARTAYPAMRVVAPVRAELGVRTIMNGLGPLLNPVGVQYQIVGVYSKSLCEPFAAALGELGAKRALVVHGSDGLDELTITGPSSVSLVEAGALRSFELDPRALGLEVAKRAQIAGGDVRENAAILFEVLAGKPGPRRDIVLLNAAGALFAAGAAAGIEEGLALARESIDSGAARERLEALVRATGEAS